jgi:hypothetical protein
MSNIIFACRTIFDEVNLAISETGVDHPVIWIESRLHERPDNLRAKLQEEINKISNVKYIILAFGHCGNAVVGLKSESSFLVIPRVDDCIALLLGCQAKRYSLSHEMGTYYLTRGWLEYENSILNEYERSAKRYGQERAVAVVKTMLENYMRLVVIDTGAYRVEACLEQVQKLANVLNIKYQIMPGSGILLKSLLTGQWDHDFCIIPPGSRITFDLLMAKKRIKIK